MRGKLLGSIRGVGLRSFGLATALSVAPVLRPALAAEGGATLDWIAGEGGSFQEPKNWSFGFAPRVNDVARFGYREGAYDVRIDALATLEAVESWRASVRLLLQGQTLSVVRAGPEAPSLTVGAGQNESAALALDGFGRVNALHAAVGAGVGANATLSVLGGARFTAADALTIGGEGAGTVTVDAFSRLTAASTAVRPGSVLTGAGTIVTALQCGGALRAGGYELASTLTVQGSCFFEDSGSLLVGVRAAPGAPLPGVDRLRVIGALHLDGALRFSTFAGFVPAFGDSFVVAIADSISGQFDALDAPALPDSLFYSIEYLPTQVRINVVPAPTGACAFGGGAALWARRRPRA